MTLRDTHKEFKNPWKTKYHLVGFTNDAELLKNMKWKDPVIMEIFNVKESNNLIGRENFGARTQKLECWSAWNNWINLPFLWKPTHMQKNQHYSSIQFWHIADLILHITFGMSRCAWPPAGLTKKKKLGAQFWNIRHR